MKHSQGPLTSFVVDAWGYRTFNLGVLAAAKAARVEELVAANPKDERTTPFCRWVHGKVVKVRQIEARVASFVEASQGMDRTGIVNAMPFINQSQKALRLLKEANGGSLQLGFRRHFGRFRRHVRCRYRNGGGNADKRNKLRDGDGDNKHDIRN